MAFLAAIFDVAEITPSPAPFQSLIAVCGKFPRPTVVRAVSLTCPFVFDRDDICPWPQSALNHLFRGESRFWTLVHASCNRSSMLARFSDLMHDARCNTETFSRDFVGKLFPQRYSCCVVKHNL